MNVDATEKPKIVILAFVLFAVIILIRLFYLQVVDNEYAEIAKRNALLYMPQRPARGMIMDRNGTPLVSNETIYDLMIIPSEAKNIDTVSLCKAVKISKDALDVAFKDMYKTLHSRYQPVALIKRLPKDIYISFQEKQYKFPGFYMQTRTTRKYDIQFGGNLVGYVAEVDKNDIARDPYYNQGEYIGKSGIEASYEKILRGRKGVNIYTRDSKNRIQGRYKDGEEDTIAIAGKDIICSIDANLQTFGEELMQNKIGAIVAIEPSTGEVLALVSAPSFDPALLSEQNRAANYRVLQSNPYKPLFNRAIMSFYPPGSTFKLANALIGLQEGTLTPDMQYGCSRGYHVGRGVGCHSHPSPLDMTHSIMMSCNAYYCNVFRRIIDNPSYESIYEALNKWIEYCHSFGFGRKLGTDLFGEKAGILPSAKTYDKIHGENHWSSLSIISLAIGQGEIGITPLQLANFMATIANRGYFIAPHVVKRIEGENSIDSVYLRRNYTMVDTINYAKIIQGMYLAVNAPSGSGGTARNAYVKDLNICGKTGTAQNPHGADHSVFACFAPRENPKIAIAVYVENGFAGARWAAPIAGLMAEKYINGEISDERKSVFEYVKNANLLDFGQKQYKQ